MGLRDLFRRLLGAADAPPSTTPAPAGGKLGLDDLSRRMGLPVDVLRGIKIEYRDFEIRKRSGNMRKIAAPVDELKQVQRLILHRVIGRLRVHSAVHGFEADRSIVTNALPHVGRAVILKLDIKDFFASTTAERVGNFFADIGWDRATAELLARLCTYRGALPQGAPTSPRLSSLVNYPIDARLSLLARGFRLTTRNPQTGKPISSTVTIPMSYTRYADDITFSFAQDDPAVTHAVVRLVKSVLADYGYEIHQHGKLQIRRRHDRQLVTGIVVNQVAQLPRETRRKLRATRNHRKRGQSATLTDEQLAGWDALQRMIEAQSRGPMKDCG